MGDNASFCIGLPEGDRLRGAKGSIECCLFVAESRVGGEGARRLSSLLTERLPDTRRVPETIRSLVWVEPRGGDSTVRDKEGKVRGPRGFGESGGERALTTVAFGMAALTAGVWAMEAFDDVLGKKTRGAVWGFFTGGGGGDGVRFTTLKGEA